MIASPDRRRLAGLTLLYLVAIVLVLGAFLRSAFTVPAFIYQNF